MQNKGAAGVDRMTVDELSNLKDSHRKELLYSITNWKYIPQAILGVSIPKSNGKTRLLGIPTVVDRWLQQAVSEVLRTKFELEFEDYSYGFPAQRRTSKRQYCKHRNTSMMAFKVL